MAARCYLVTGRGKEGISAHRDEGLVSRTDAMGKAHGGQGAWLLTGGVWYLLRRGEWQAAHPAACIV